jgi:1-acyl-sn-glycerol-3-phosphate acyltransferase
MSTLRRRLVSVTGLLVAALGLLVLIPLWLPIAALADVVRARLRLPTVRLLLFALGWAWLESTGVLIAFGLWATGRRRNHTLHYRLQTWWAANLVGVLRATTGIQITAGGIDQLTPGPVILLCRHVSLADSLASAWVITSLADMQPRYVLKRELLADPCLDIVGSRLPNHFLDRQATDTQGELDQLTALCAGMGEQDVAVIFPEGTRASATKRQRALQKLAERDPERAERLGPLQHLLPPRPAGAAALLKGAPNADVVIGWHVGFDGLDTFGGILRHLTRKPPPVLFRLRRVARVEVPNGDAFVDWLDATWLQADRDVDQLMSESHP